MNTDFNLQELLDSIVHDDAQYIREQRAAALRAAATGNWMYSSNRTITCRCGKVGQELVMHRWHLRNCKVT